MTSDPSGSLIAVLAPLLQSLERLRFISRHLDPAVFHSVLTAVGAPDAPLRAALPALAD